MIALAYPEPASAYIDPGTGSALFYVISGIVVSIYFGARSFYYRILEALLRVRHLDQRCEVAIHCEDPRYEITFLPVIRELVSCGVKPTFFTMYNRDDSYEALPQGVTHRNISSGLIGYAYLNNIQAVLVVTTTPQLDVMTFRRSRRVRHYTYIQHALGESRFVRPYAFDYFDSILCCGPILKANIRKLEELRGSKAKELYDTGIPHYEELLNQRQAAFRPASHRPVVLVAPSWGPLSMFEAFGVEFITSLAERFEVIVRPHPQMKVSQEELYQKVLSLQGVTVDTSRTPANALSKADILLSDISGIAHEFAFIYEKPVVVIDRQLAMGGLEGELLGGDSELKQRCAEFIVPVPPEEIGAIVSHLERVLQNPLTERIAAVRSQLVYNFGSASAVAAVQLCNLLEREKSKQAASRSFKPVKLFLKAEK